ncbi:Coiled-coil domain-containing protein 22 -like protein [Halotydeus destructor]|nr:Coiled-coil domain-containing protein 22 -like protein [Halotydeus destructor]
MDEVDAIIFRQLKAIGCPIEDEKTSIKEFDADLVIVCAAKCLNIIDSDDQQSSISSTSLNMATKYKVATHLSEKCIQLGFKGELGYQTFLYSAEADIRRIFLFLIDKLPKDEGHHSPTVTEDDDLISRLRRSNTSNIWLPPTYPDDFVVSEADCMSSKNLAGLLNTKSILGNKMAPNRQKYYNNYARISANASALINWNSSQINAPPPSRQKIVLEHLAPEISEVVASRSIEHNDDAEVKVSVHEEAESKESYEERMQKVVDELQQELDSLRSQKTQISEKCIKFAEQSNQLEEMLKADKAKLIAMRSSDKSVNDLESEVTNQEQDLQMMADQWAELESDYTSRMAEIRFRIDERDSSNRAAKRELEEVKKAIQSKSRELKDKEIQVAELSGKVQKDQQPGRTAYTKRILEIVNNVKKQKEQTRNVLAETRDLQKEINILQGKVQRAFTVADESMFRGAKEIGSDWARKCYRLLAGMRDHCDQIMSAIDETGVMKREVMSLEELLERDQTKMIDSNLVRIQADLKQITIENQKLSNMSNNQP